MSDYLCADPNCGHPYEAHNSVIVPWGCTVVDGTSIDCVNGYQGKRPPPQGVSDSGRRIWDLIDRYEELVQQFRAAAYDDPDMATREWERRLTREWDVLRADVEVFRHAGG